LGFSGVFCHGEDVSTGGEEIGPVRAGKKGLDVDLARKMPKHELRMLRSRGSEKNARSIAFNTPIRNGGKGGRKRRWQGDTGVWKVGRGFTTRVRHPTGFSTMVRMANFREGTCLGRSKTALPPKVELLGKMQNDTSLLGVAAWAYAVTSQIEIGKRFTKRQKKSSGEKFWRKLPMEH